ncbi:unnamed protein product [Adineta ricciae]|uniref:UDP-glucose 6-dehydrogenase n=1 Tax=Adineta ricciae TaxID=249248 RepID=A0A815SW74_ADIRI|nr:unnamed protein product [Adineta ricciae]
MQINSCYLSLLLMTLFLFSMLIIGGVISIGLIPIYLQNNAVFPETKTSTKQYELNYITNLTNVGSLNVSNIDALSSNLNTILALNRIQIIDAGLVIVTNGRRKKRETIQCENSEHLNDNVLRVKFVIEYPRGCGTISCQQRSTNHIIFNIKNLFPSITIPIHLNNNQTIFTLLYFCSFDHQQTLTIISSCVNQTTALVCGSGSAISKCENTKPCSKDSDCISDFCRIADQTCQTPTCTDNYVNQDETDIDCGGRICGIKCSLNKTCRKDGDCTTGFCRLNDKTCQISTCTDNYWNGDETDVDCGGSVCSTKCSNNKSCEASSDCQAGFCRSNDKTCQTPSCSDGYKNQDETDVDCGGSVCSTQCIDSETCSQNSDCTSGYCRLTDQTCRTATCTDGFQNQDETDVDCGGLICTATCALTKFCGRNPDCTSGFCRGTDKTCRVSGCSDGFRNQDETDIDCGGSTCGVKCPLTKTCGKDADCQSGFCRPTDKTCQTATCSDSLRNQDESDVDCGGTACTAKCANGLSCGKNADCTSAFCRATDKSCQTPSCSDGYKNQDETDTDCGGSVCSAKCPDTKSCGKDADCQNGFCRPTDKTCRTATCSDSLRNQDETDVDCGGTMKSIGVIGAGYVGLSLAVEFGKSRPTVAYDMNEERIEKLKNGHDPNLESSDDNLKSSKYLKFTTNMEDLHECQIFIVAVPTPIDENNRPDLFPLQNASETIGKILKINDIVIYESTVYPGVTEDICVKILEEVSHLRYNIDFFCGYSPERINPGDKLHTLRTIRKITSGSTPAIAQEIDALYKEIIEAGTFMVSSIKIAEAAKLFENSQRDINIAFVNELSRIFNLAGIDTHEVLEATRTKWNCLPFEPGLVGGHCIAVDPYYLIHMSLSLNYIPEMILAGRRINDTMSHYISSEIVKTMLKKGISVINSKILILGITFKENCPDIRNSKIIDIIEDLEEFGCHVDVVDPWASKKHVFDEFGIEIKDLDRNINFDDYHGIVIGVAHQQFKSLDFSSIKSSKKIIYDIKGILPRDCVDARL